MPSSFRLLSAVFFASLVHLSLPAHLTSQVPVSSSSVASGLEVPEAPRPQLPIAQLEPSNPDGVLQTANSGEQESSNSSSQASPAAPQKSLHDQAEEQLRAQEHQRVAGLMATFNTTRNRDALPLSPGQKFSLFFKSATDPWAFTLAGAVAGISQAGDGEPTWGQGTLGYSHRVAVNYADYFIGNFFGNAVLPSLLHEDPRYFQKGTGSHVSRILWAAGSTVWARRDHGGWGPNWANVGGNMIGTAIGRAYYPPDERTVSGTILDGLTVTAEGVVGAEVIEFWPDLVRMHRRKQAEKLAKAQAKTQAGASEPLADRK